MQTYILRVYSADPINLSVTGMLEDIESGTKKHFSSFNDLITVLANSVGRGQLGLSESIRAEPISMNG